MSTSKTTMTAAAATRLTLRFPFWTEVFYSMEVHEATPEQIAAGLHTEATDGRSLWINRKFFTSIPLDQQVAELVHELSHKIYLHPTRRNGRDPEMWNVACDYAINAMMKSNGFAIPSDWLLDMKYDGWLAEKIYEDLKRQQKEGGGGGSPKLGPGRADLVEPKFNSQEEKERFEQQVQQTVERALAMAKLFGKVPVGMETSLTEAYKPVKEPWYNHLHRYMQSLCVSNYDWARINRRALITHKCLAPSVISTALGTIVIARDTSGSCFTKAVQANFTGHMNAILAEAKPRRIVTLDFDTQVYPGPEFEAGEYDISYRGRGGGGTSFVPIFEWIEREGIVPDVCVVLTDLCGQFPHAGPDYPVVWASTDAFNESDIPFGEAIHVEV